MEYANYYITVVTPKSSFCGKTFSLDANGNIVKKSGAAVPMLAAAETVPCNSLYDLAEIINRLDIGQAIILGWIPETVQVKEYGLVSMDALAKIKGGEIKEDGERSSYIVRRNGNLYLPRKKILFEQAPFFCLDRDVAEDAPESVQAIQSLSNGDFIKLLCEKLGDGPAAAFYGASFLPVTSSSGQVFKEDGTPYVTDPSCHIFFQAKDRLDVERFGTALFAHSFAQGFGYDKAVNRKDDVKAFRKQSIFDVSVFTKGRLFFESQPLVREGVVCMRQPVRVVTWAGQKVNTQHVKDPDFEMRHELAKHGMSWESGRVESHLSSDDLYPEMVIETQKYGEITVDYYKNNITEKVRCQTPFRDSSSWAAYLNRHNDGEVYLWDEGTRTKHRLVDPEIELWAALLKGLNK